MQENKLIDVMRKHLPTNVFTKIVGFTIDDRGISTASRLLSEQFSVDIGMNKLFVWHHFEKKYSDISMIELNNNLIKAVEDRDKGISNIISSLLSKKSQEPNNLWKWLED